jgi:hypothetical protein
VPSPEADNTRTELIPPSRGLIIFLVDELSVVSSVESGRAVCQELIITNPVSMLSTDKGAMQDIVPCHGKDPRRVKLTATEYRVGLEHYLA